MIRTGDHQLGLGELRSDLHEGVNDLLEPFVGSPFPEGKNAMVRIAPLRKVRILRTSRQDSVAPHVHRAPSVLLANQAPVRGKQDGNRVRKEQQLRRNHSGCAIGRLETNAGILQIYRLHELMKRDVGVDAGHAGKRRNCNANECRQWLAAKAGESKIEPHDIRFLTPDFSKQPPGIAETVESPAAHHVVAIELGLCGIEIVAEDRDLETFCILQLARDVETVFVQRLPAMLECRD